MQEQTAAASEVFRRGKMRSGEDYLRALKGGRRLYADGELVRDVASHPAFREAARSVAHLFDVAAAPENRDTMAYPSPRTGEPVWRAWQIPRSHADLAAKRIAAERWAEATFGLMGRTPDHVAGFIAGYAAKPALFALFVLLPLLSAAGFVRMKRAIVAMHAILPAPDPKLVLHQVVLDAWRHNLVTLYLAVVVSALLAGLLRNWLERRPRSA